MQDVGVHHQSANVGIKCLWYMSPGGTASGTEYPKYKSDSPDNLTTTIQH